MYGLWKEKIRIFRSSIYMFHFFNSYTVQLLGQYLFSCLYLMTPLSASFVMEHCEKIETLKDAINQKSFVTSGIMKIKIFLQLIDL